MANIKDSINQKTNNDINKQVFKVEDKQLRIKDRKMIIFEKKKIQSELQEAMTNAGAYIGFDDPARFISFIDDLTKIYEINDIKQALEFWVINSDFKRFGLEYISNFRTNNVTPMQNQNIE